MIGSRLRQPLFLVLLAAMWSLAIKPLPLSDWAYYWDAASGVAGYERGGALLFVLRMIQALDLEPYTAALAINLVAAFSIMAIPAWPMAGESASQPRLFWPTFSR